MQTAKDVLNEVDEDALVNLVVEGTGFSMDKHLYDKMTKRLAECGVSKPTDLDYIQWSLSEWRDFHLVNGFIYIN